MRGLIKLPPPICNPLRLARYFTDIGKNSLLHQALASCGRVIMFLCLALFLLTLTACEKEIPAEDDALTRAAQPNDSTASGGLGIVVTIDTVWKGETYINY
jgi:hypothetical protein